MVSGTASDDRSVLSGNSQASSIARAEEVAVEFRLTKKELLESAIVRHNAALASLVETSRA